MKFLPTFLPKIPARGISAAVASLGAIAAPLAWGVTYDQTIFAVTNMTGSNISNKAANGFSSAGLVSTGGMEVTANGLLLTYATVGTGERPIIDNVEDITAAGIQLDRYLSFTLEPDNFDALAGYSGGYTINLTDLTRNMTLETGGHMEIRTSLDNFSSTLASYSAGNLVPVAPGLTTSGSLIFANGAVTSTDVPLEFRIYTWYDTPGVTGYLGDNGDAIRVRYSITTTSIPEPSGVLILGTAGALQLLRRRRVGATTVR